MTIITSIFFCFRRLYGCYYNPHQLWRMLIRQRSSSNCFVLNLQHTMVYTIIMLVRNGQLSNLFFYFKGERHYTAKVHLLLHFANSVRDLGPLWAHSAFPFDDTNGWLGDLFHGTRDPHKQVLHTALTCFF